MSKGTQLNDNIEITVSDVTINPDTAVLQLMVRSLESMCTV